MDVSFQSRVSKSGPGYESFDVTIKTSINAVLGTAHQERILDLPNGDRLRVTVQHLIGNDIASARGMPHGDPCISGTSALADQLNRTWRDSLAQAAVVDSGVSMADVVMDGFLSAQDKAVFRAQFDSVPEALKREQNDLDQAQPRIHIEYDTDTGEEV